MDMEAIKYQDLKQRALLCKHKLYTHIQGRMYDKSQIGITQTLWHYYLRCAQHI